MFLTQLIYYYIKERRSGKGWSKSKSLDLNLPPTPKFKKDLFASEHREIVKKVGDQVKSFPQPPPSRQTSSDRHEPPKEDALLPPPSSLAAPPSRSSVGGNVQSGEAQRNPRANAFLSPLPAASVAPGKEGVSKKPSSNGGKR
jgi:hypothetical protein